ncbi:probable mannosyltransferase Ktr4p [Monosporozyma servazzii]
MRGILFGFKRFKVRTVLLLLCAFSVSLGLLVYFQRLTLLDEHLEVAKKTYSQMEDYLKSFSDSEAYNSTLSEMVPPEEVVIPLEQDEIDKILDRLQTPLYNDTIVQEHSKEIVKENMDLYKNVVNMPIIEPQVDDLVRPGHPLAGKANATILSLVQNQDITAIVSTIEQLEDKFNNKFGYPYTFMNDNDFSEAFKKEILSVLPKERVVHFVKVNPDDWKKPASIDNVKYIECVDKLASEEVQYVKKVSYHNMCRFYSRKFYHQEVMTYYKYAWRIEPNVNFYCNIDYDIFQFMEMHDKVYGFTLNLYDSPQSIRSLWNDTLEFVKENPQYLNRHGSYEWLKENLQKPENYNITNGYSTCHFWTNFEITNLDFLRSEPYEKYMDFLEDKGGFYYERWGDAPVRSLALGLFADKSRIHWFRDVAYHHFPYTNCPNSPADSNRCDRKCSPGKFTPYDNLYIENCMPSWLKYSMSDDQLKMYEPRDTST